MPTASQFRTAAHRLVGARDELASLLRPVIVRAEGLVLEGTPHALLASVIGVTSANVATSIRLLQDQIDEATRRAEVCEAWSRDVRRYHASDDTDRIFPARPASWVAFD